MNYQLIDTVCGSLVNGQYEQALTQLIRGCKQKPLTFAARCMRVHHELLGLGQSGTAERFTQYIERKGEQS